MVIRLSTASLLIGVLLLVNLLPSEMQMEEDDDDDDMGDNFESELESNPKPHRNRNDGTTAHSSVVHRRLLLKRALSNRLSPIHIRSVCDPRTDFWCQLPSSSEERKSEEKTKELYSTEDVVTQGMLGEVLMNVEPRGLDSALVSWDLPIEDKDWNYGIDIAYSLTQLGGCSDNKVNEQPITKYNVQERRIMLEDLKPGSHYEVTVTRRKPPNLQMDVKAPKTTRTFQTQEEAPNGPPTNLRVDSRKDTELGYQWEAPTCDKQNGHITRYEYELIGLDDWNKDSPKRKGVTPRSDTVIDKLLPGSHYQMRVRAYTAIGQGPWSKPINIHTTGSKLGPPRDLTAMQPREIQLTWLPPHPQLDKVTDYRIRYSLRNDNTSLIEMTLSSADLSCDGYKGGTIGADSLCMTIKGLLPQSTYHIQVQGRSESGNWGEWSTNYFSTTRESDDGPIGGSLKLLSAGSDNLKVQWTAPAIIKTKINTYKVYILVAYVIDQSPKEYIVTSDITDYHFRALEPTTPYNITIQGLTNDNKFWLISGVFDTTDIVKGLLQWLPAPTDLHLIEKSDTMMHVTWNPPEVLNPQWRELITHYRVTIAPYDPISRLTGPNRTYTVPVPGNRIKFRELDPETIYNIIVQAGTSIGYGEVLWGAYSTLAPGQQHILRLKSRTPTSLTVQWDPVWGTSHRGYTITARPVHSVNPSVILGTMKMEDVDAMKTEWKIRGLNPSTIYNVTLQPKDQPEGAWGAYATLPPGWFVVRNLKHCDQTDFATSMSWEPIDDETATHYQVRYAQTNVRDGTWVEQHQNSKHNLLCPEDCNRLCYLVFNLEKNPSEYIFQVRAYVEGRWNHWKSVSRASNGDLPEVKRSYCIFPPPSMVKNIGAEGTTWEVDIAPVNTGKNVSRYYVVIDKRDPPGDTNWTHLTNKVTAKKLNMPYYVAGSFNRETLPTARKFKIGDGKVYGGYLNYPLVKGKKYNWEFYTVWKVDGKPVVERQRGGTTALRPLSLTALIMVIAVYLVC